MAPPNAGGAPGGHSARPCGGCDDGLALDRDLAVLTAAGLIEIAGFRHNLPVYAAADERVARAGVDERRASMKLYATGARDVQGTVREPRIRG